MAAAVTTWVAGGSYRCEYRDADGKPLPLRTDVVVFRASPLERIVIEPPKR